MFCSKVNEFELKVLLILTGHLLHELVGNLLPFLSIIIFHLLKGCLFELGFRLFDLLKVAIIVVDYFEFVWEVLYIGWIEFDDEEQGVVHEVEVVKKTDVATYLVVDFYHILNLEFQAVFLLFQMKEVDIFQHSGVLERSAKHFSFDDTSFEIENLLDVLALAYFAVSHQNEKNWVLIVHLDGINAVDTSNK